MSPLFSLPFMLPTLYMLQMMSLCGLNPGGQDRYLSDLE